MLQTSSNNFVKNLYPPENVANLKRPPTSVIQFRVCDFRFFAYFRQNQVNALTDTLMSCHPHYIRCIRPNTLKQPKTYDMGLCTNQVRYLGLLENVRVRRAGFAYR